MTRTIPASAGQPAVYPLLAQLAGWCLVTVAIAACVDRSRHADLGGAIAAPLSLFVMAVAVYTPQINRYLFTPAATPHAVFVTWVRDRCGRVGLDLRRDAGPLAPVRT